MNLFKKLCKQNQVWKYNLIRGRLNVCTQRHVRDRKAARDAAVRAHVQAVAAELATGTLAVEKTLLGFAICQDLTHLVLGEGLRGRLKPLNSG